MKDKFVVAELVMACDYAAKELQAEQAHARLMLLRGASGDAQAALIACRLFVDNPTLFTLDVTD